jgi:hypothetical protein
VAVELSNQNGRKLAVQRDLSPAVERAFDLTGIAERLPFAE